MIKKQRDFSNPDTLRIAPRHDGGNDWTVADYKRTDFATEEGWAQAIRIFEDRIRARFIEPADFLARMRYTGFAVLALDCLLIETLMQFRKGKKETPSRQSANYFIEFLTTTAFRDDFDECKARLFYEQVRCGILHQAEVKGSTRIRTDSDLPLVQCAPDGKGLIINRRKFHDKLKAVFNDYIEQLRDPANKELQTNFRKKMDFICHVK